MSYIKYPLPTHGEFLGAGSESEKYRALVCEYLSGAVADVASQGAPVVPWAISVDMPEPQFSQYSGGRPPKGPIHIRAFADDLPFGDKSLDAIYSSHFLEDIPYDRWHLFLEYWGRKVKSGGYVIVICPERTRWRRYLDQGGIPNCSHRHEPLLGEMSEAAKKGGLTVVKEWITDLFPEDYSIIGIFKAP